MPSPYTRRTHKRCNACGKEKALSEFYYAKPQKHYSYNCRPCECARRKEAYRKCRESVRTVRNEEETKALLADGWHTCGYCGIRKPIGEFGRRQINGRLLVLNKCKDCRVLLKDKLIADPWTKFLYAVKARCNVFSITLRDYLMLLQAQEFKCDVCGNVLPLTDQALDHDHATGAIRGILHNKCNVLLGLAGERPETLVNAGVYLERHQSRNNH